MKEQNGALPKDRTKIWKQFVHEFHNKSDRTTAIISAVFLESQLEQLLTNFFVDSPKIIERLLSPGSALGNLETRTYAAYALGLISENEYNDLRLISEIRNTLVKQDGGQFFDDTDIRDLCLDFNVPREILHPNDSPTPRRIFILTSVILARQLAQRTNQAESQRRSVPNPIKFSTS